MSRWLRLTILGVLCLGSACGGTTTTAGNGGNGGSGSDGRSCSPKGTTLEVTARNIRFNADCLAAPGGRAFRVVFHNRDEGVTHNVAIYPQEGDPVFRGEIFDGLKTRTYQVEALEAGRYRFQCDIHPDMNGVFVVS